MSNKSKSVNQSLHIHVVGACSLTTTLLGSTNENDKTLEPGPQLVYRTTLTYFSAAPDILLSLSQVYGHHSSPKAPPLLHLYKSCDRPDLDRGHFTGFPSVLLQWDGILLPENCVHGQLAWWFWRKTPTEVQNHCSHFLCNIVKLNKEK